MGRFALSLRQSAVRLRREWRFSVAVAGIFALGIGPAAAMVSVVDKILLRPLDYADAGRVGLIRITRGSLQGHPGLSQHEALRIRESGVFESLEIQQRVQDVSYGPPENLISTKQMFVTTGVFPMLGIHPVLGRGFTEEDIPPPPVFPPLPRPVPGQPPPPLPPPPPPAIFPVLLDYGTWQRVFGSDRGVLDRIITINAAPYKVIGVLPKGVRVVTGRAVPQAIDFYSPFKIFDNRGQWFYPTLARVKRGMTFAQAQAALDGVSAKLAKDEPDTYAVSNFRWTIEPVLDDITRETRPALRAAMGAVLLLLAIAFANAAALVVARLRTRDLDFAIRSAIGATRGALLIDALAEAAVLGAAGALGGALVAFLAVLGIREVIPRTVPRWDDIGIGWDSLLYASAFAFIGLVITGVVPVWRITRGAMWNAIRSGSAQGGKAEASRPRLALVTAQIALTVVLGFGCAQLIRSAMALGRLDLGYDANVMAFGVGYDFRAYLPAVITPQSIAEARAGLYQRIRNRVAQLPGVASVGVASHIPLGGTAMSDAYQPDLTKEVNLEPYANYFPVGPGYLTTIKAPFMQGRDFTDDEDRQAQRVIIVDETLAKSAFPAMANVIGQKIKAGWGLQEGTIVGVVKHQRSIDVTRAIRPQIYAPIGNLFQNLGFVVVRGSNLRDKVPAIVSAIGDEHPGRAVSNIVMISDNVKAATSALTSVTTLIVCLAVSAGVLSAIGLYLVLSFIVFQQRRATAIRTALGASRAQVMWQHGRKSAIVIAVAIPLGLAMAIALSPYFADLLFGVGRRDPMSLLIAATLAVLTAAIGTGVPVVRAANANVVKVLRGD